MTIHNPDYADASGARRAAKNQGITNAGLVTLDNGRVQLRNLDRPLYNDAARKKSKVKGAVGIVWDLCAKCIPEGSTRAEVVAMAVEAGVNVNTAKTQYQRYLAAAGLTKAQQAASC